MGFAPLPTSQRAAAAGRWQASLGGGGAVRRDASGAADWGSSVEQETGSGLGANRQQQKFSYPCPNLFSLQGAGAPATQRRVLELSWLQTETINWEVSACVRVRASVCSYASVVRDSVAAG
jgi:hypothetical protein